jgi:hypothetical protein
MHALTGAHSHAASGAVRQLYGDRERPQCQDMLNLTDVASRPSESLAPFTDRLRMAVAAYLARFKGISREIVQTFSASCQFGLHRGMPLCPPCGPDPHLAGLPAVCDLK